MIPLCRHILHSGVLCEQAAVKGTNYCRHHQNQKAVVAKGQPRPDPWNMRKALPLVFPEDYAAIQSNLFLVMQALNDKLIDNPTANTLNRILRSCELNLERMERTKATQAKAEIAKRVILTPEGDEIAPPREKLEKGESPMHYKDCPCQSCAEQYRGAEPEKHHAECKCGVCVEASDQRSAVSDQEETGDQGSAISDQEKPAVREARVEQFRLIDKLDPIQKVPNYHNYIYGDEIAKHEAQHAARARAALEAGLEPPEHTPWDTSIKAAERERKRQEWKDGIDQRRKESIDKWNAEHPDQPKEFKPFLTWGEEQDLKLAEMKRLREQDEARLRGQALPAS